MSVQEAALYGDLVLALRDYAARQDETDDHLGGCGDNLCLVTM